MFLVIVANTANTKQNTKPIKTLFSLPFLNKLHSVYNIFVVRSIGTAYVFQVTLKFKMPVNCLVACTLEKKKKKKVFPPKIMHFIITSES